MRSIFSWSVGKRIRSLCFNHNTVEKYFSSITNSTIFAVSSGRGKCGVAVVRVSGPRALTALSSLTGLTSKPTPRLATVRTIKDPETQQVLDKGLFLWFPGPQSFTGEDTCEFQVHGGPAVVAGVLGALSKVKGLRPAEPGEFSKRAFYNAKLDLTQAEGLADLIEAETEMQRQQALLQMGGSLKDLYGSWRKQLLKNVANVEAYIDFSEDENIEDGVLDQVRASVLELQLQIQNHLEDGKKGERIRDGIQATIVGHPNVGKSSLLNILCCRPAAIVSSVAGTTRDIVEKHIDVGGYSLSLADTAGLRPTDDLVEHEGVQRARASARAADLLLVVLDAKQVANSRNGNEFKRIVDDYVQELEVKETRVDGGPRTLLVLNKWDILNQEQADRISRIIGEGTAYLTVAFSCVTKRGMDDLLKNLNNFVAELCGNPRRENPLLSQERHRHHLKNCLEALKNYEELSKQEESLVIAAQELRMALRALAHLTGSVTTDDILDVIFKEFCIGK